MCVCIEYIYILYIYIYIYYIIYNYIYIIYIYYIIYKYSTYSVLTYHYVLPSKMQIVGTHVVIEWMSGWMGIYSEDHGFWKSWSPCERVCFYFVGSGEP
jgi:hypothetical protein